MNKVREDLNVELFKLSGWGKGFRAYDLDYLLRKLGYAFRDLTYHSDGRWIAKSGAKYGKFLTSADTPQDAVAKLGIKLFNEGYMAR